MLIAHYHAQSQSYVQPGGIDSSIGKIYECITSDTAVRWATAAGNTNLTSCQPCPEKYFCDQLGVGALAEAKPCPVGYWCEPGTVIPYLTCPPVRDVVYLVPSTSQLCHVVVLLGILLSRYV